MTIKGWFLDRVGRRVVVAIVNEESYEYPAEVLVEEVFDEFVTLKHEVVSFNLPYRAIVMFRDALEV